ncbi:MAG: glycosyltransferase family 2 protein [Terrisporobacter sp.]
MAINDKLVSVIIPVYNAEYFLENTVNSALNQTYKDIEIILIDDMSTDKSRDIISKFAEKYTNIRPILLTENKGVANARNEGIKNSNGRFIAFLDSDDLWSKDKIEKQIEYMRRNDYGFTFTGYQYINEQGEILKTVVGARKEVAYNDLLKQNLIPCLTVVIDKNKIKEVNMPKIHHEDYATWLSILKMGHKAYGLDENLALYRVRSNSLSGNKMKSAIWTWNIIRNVEKVSLPKAIYYFSNYALVNVKKRFL